MTRMSHLMSPPYKKKVNRKLLFSHQVKFCSGTHLDVEITIIILNEWTIFFVHSVTPVRQTHSHICLKAHWYSSQCVSIELLWSFSQRMVSTHICSFAASSGKQLMAFFFACVWQVHSDSCTQIHIYVRPSERKTSSTVSQELVFALKESVGQMLSVRVRVCGYVGVGGRGCACTDRAAFEETIN